MNASRDASPPLARRPSSPANTTKQATISPSVTKGVRWVGLASRSGITRAPGQGFLVGFGIAFDGSAEGADDGLALGPAVASGTATRTAWLMLSDDSQT